MHYKKYEVRSPLFALKNPRLSEEVLAAFAGVRKVRPLETRKPAVRVYHVKRAR
jgi:hypothetical protein